MSQARKDADSQMSVRIKDPGLRAWLLMNMRQDPKTKEIGWKINIDGIHAAFIKNIARFPEVTTTCERWASQAKELFVIWGGNEKNLKWVRAKFSLKTTVFGQYWKWRKYFHKNIHP